MQKVDQLGTEICRKFHMFHINMLGINRYHSLILLEEIGFYAFLFMLSVQIDRVFGKTG